MYNSIRGGYMIHGHVYVMKILKFESLAIIYDFIHVCVQLISTKILSCSHDIILCESTPSPKNHVCFMYEISP